MAFSHIFLCCKIRYSLGELVIVNISVYAPAFQSGAITPATVVRDMPSVFSEPGVYPLNDTRTYAYARTIYRAVVRSVNAASVSTLEKTGESYAYKFASEKFRISTLVENYVDAGGNVHTDIDVGPLALGAQTLGVERHFALFHPARVL